MIREVICIEYCTEPGARTLIISRHPGGMGASNVQGAYQAECNAPGERI